VQHPALATAVNPHSSGMIVAGRTGSGKTAILRAVQHKNDEQVEIDPAEMAMDYVANSDALRFVQAIGGDLGPVDKLIGPEAGGGDMYEAEIAC